MSAPVVEGAEALHDAGALGIVQRAQLLQDIFAHVLLHVHLYHLLAPVMVSTGAGQPTGCGLAGLLCFVPFFS